MKALVKTGIFFVLVSLFTLNISAQKPGRGKQMNPEEKATKQTEWMTKELNLNSDQQAKIKQIHLKHAEQMKKQRDAVQESAKKDKEQMREQMKAQREAHNAEIKSVLTTEQYQTWEAKKKEFRKEDGRKHQGRKNDGHKKTENKSKGQRVEKQKDA